VNKKDGHFVDIWDK